MEHLTDDGRAAEPADDKTFTGSATVKRFLAADPQASGRVYRVAFTAGARTHWHTHSDVQLLLVTEGRCRAQVEGQAAIVATAGDVVRFEAGEKHWHGATAAGPMTHVAINLGEHTEWLEPVTDAQVSGA